MSNLSAQIAEMMSRETPRLAEAAHFARRFNFAGARQFGSTATSSLWQLQNTDKMKRERWMYIERDKGTEKEKERA